MSLKYTGIKKLDDTCLTLMRSAMSQLQLSARTIADLAGSESSQSAHLAEALHHRPRLMEG